MLSGKGVDMPVCVTTAKGQTILVDVQSSNTIDDVMLKIRVSTGTPIANIVNIQLAAHDYMAAGQTCEPFLLKSLGALVGSQSRMDRRLDARRRAVKQHKKEFRLLCQATLNTSKSEPPCLLFCGMHGPQHQEKMHRLVFL